MTASIPIYLDYNASTPIDPAVVATLATEIGLGVHVGHVERIAHQTGYGGKRCTDFEARKA